MLTRLRWCSVLGAIQWSLAGAVAAAQTAAAREKIAAFYRSQGGCGWESGSWDAELQND